MNYTNKTKVLIVGTVFAVAFLAVMSLPVSTNACGGYGGCGYYNPAPYQYNISYSHVPSPVVVQQPVIQQPVYIQQPVIQPVYIQPTVYQQPVYYSPLTVSCSANNSTSGNYNGYNNYNTYNNNNTYNGYNSYNGYNNNSVTWTAYASGGNGNYTYSWSGSDGLYGSGQSVYFNYSTPGSKYAYVTVYSNGQSMTQSCTTYTAGTQYVAYQQPIIQQSVYVQPTIYQQQNNLDIGCYVDPTNARVNQPITWSVEVTGGIAPYTYNWSGTDNLTGSLSSVTKYYSTTGSKSAIVSVTSADGKTGTHACSNTLTIASAPKNIAYKAPAKVIAAPVVEANTSNAAAASIFSLSNVPWGWVAILIILVLFVTVMYLLLNRQKI
jgi:hypothetical protein